VLSSDADQVANLLRALFSTVSLDNRTSPISQAVLYADAVSHTIASDLAHTQETLMESMAFSNMIFDNTAFYEQDLFTLTSENSVIATSGDSVDVSQVLISSSWSALLKVTASQPLCSDWVMSAPAGREIRVRRGGVYPDKVVKSDGLTVSFGSQKMVFMEGSTKKTANITIRRAGDPVVTGTTSVFSFRITASSDVAAGLFKWLVLTSGVTHFVNSSMGLQTPANRGVSSNSYVNEYSKADVFAITDGLSELVSTTGPPTRDPINDDHSIVDTFNATIIDLASRTIPAIPPGVTSNAIKAIQSEPVLNGVIESVGGGLDTIWDVFEDIVLFAVELFI
jgi:hypothetical protein